MTMQSYEYPNTASGEVKRAEADAIQRYRADTGKLGKVVSVLPLGTRQDRHAGFAVFVDEYRAR